MRKKDQLFFHDLINQIHGMGLFLNHKIHRNEGLKTKECRSFLEELTILQALVEDHFNDQHKDLNLSRREHIELAEAKKGIFSIVKNFLGDKIPYHLTFKGDSKGPISMTAFYRILNNVVKNIAECEKCGEAEFVFDYRRDGLYLTVKNKASPESVEGSAREEAKTRAKKYQGPDHGPDHGPDLGLGLESITVLCQSLGGSFRFSREGDYWANEVFLPRP